MDKRLSVRNFRIEDATWEELKRLAHPESASVLVRKILRDYVRKAGEK